LGHFTGVQPQSVPGGFDILGLSRHAYVVGNPIAKDRSHRNATRMPASGVPYIDFGVYAGSGRSDPPLGSGSRFKLEVVARR